jgi:hypothetical protein
MAYELGPARIPGTGGRATVLEKDAGGRGRRGGRAIFIAPYNWFVNKKHLSSHPLQWCILAPWRCFSDAAGDT